LAVSSFGEVEDCKAFGFATRYRLPAKPVFGKFQAKVIGSG
jgi:hypothetical protein